MEVSIQILSSNQSGDVWPPGDGQGGNSPLLDGGLVKRFYEIAFTNPFPGGGISLISGSWPASHCCPGRSKVPSSERLGSPSNRFNARYQQSISGNAGFPTG